MLNQFKASLASITSSTCPAFLKIKLLDGLLSQLKSQKPSPLPHHPSTPPSPLKPSDLLETCATERTSPPANQSDLWADIDQLQTRILSTRTTKADLEEQIEISICQVDDMEELINERRRLNEELGREIGVVKERVEERREQEMMNKSSSTKVRGMSHKSIGSLLKSSFKSLWA